MASSLTNVLNSSWASVLSFSILQLLALSVIASGLAFFITVREIFKPPHKQQAPKGKKWKLPPGPPGYPIVGNLYDARQNAAEIKKLDRFGEMATLQVGSKTWVVLNTTRLINELYSRKGSITNGRPETPVVSGLISRNKRSVWLHPPEWTERRRVMHQLLSGTATSRYADMQDEESVQLLAEYVYRPEEWWKSHGRYANSVICRIAFGQRVLRMTPRLRSLLFDVVLQFVFCAPPNNYIDCFPLLARIVPKPLQWWRRQYEAMGQQAHDVYKSYWDPVHKAILDGAAPPSFARDVLVGEDAKYSGSDEDAMWLSGQLIEAGSDTTRASLNIFVMAAAQYPDVMAKARKEIDAICGAEAERLPTFGDFEKLSYLPALIKELLRWRPIFTWTPEHTLTSDLEFEGYSFPKGTGFVLNHQAICFNADEFKDPYTFRPERWLDGNERDFLHGLTSFGGGRRVCVGYRLAQNSLFINVARLIYCFDFTPLADEIQRGAINDMELHHECPAEPFPVTPTIRSAKHRQLILSEAERMNVLRFAKGEFTAEEAGDT